MNGRKKGAKHTLLSPNEISVGETDFVSAVLLRSDFFFIRLRYHDNRNYFIRLWSELVLKYFSIFDLFIFFCLFDFFLSVHHSIPIHFIADSFRSLVHTIRKMNNWIQQWMDIELFITNINTQNWISARMQWKIQIDIYAMHSGWRFFDCCWIFVWLNWFLLKMNEEIIKVNRNMEHRTIRLECVYERY